MKENFLIFILGMILSFLSVPIALLAAAAGDILVALVCLLAAMFGAFCSWTAWHSEWGPKEND